MSKTLRLAFFASMVLNLLLLGIILGRMPHGFDGRRTRQQRMDETLKKLPEPAQTRFREKFAQMRAAVDPLRREIGEARAETLRLLGVDPFNEAAYDRQISKIQELRAEMFKRMGQDFKETAKQFSLEERRMLADVLRRPGPSK